MMNLNIDFSKRVVIETSSLDWVPSPNPAVQRKLLERDGGEIARACSMVRYAPRAQFENHTHEKGEEIFVLEGTFADELGEYQAGTYIKNPPGSKHAPYSKDGCVLFVKLRHLLNNDLARVVVSTHSAQWFQGLVPGLNVMPLDKFESYHTALVRWAPQTFFNQHRHYGGEEIFVIDGVFEDEHGRYPQHTWIRSPHMSQHQPFSREGCTILVKTGHLDTEYM
jgi:anti-sigma factor ChrR (cupin superfamily)